MEETRGWAKTRKTNKQRVSTYYQVTIISMFMQNLLKYTTSNYNNSKHARKDHLKLPQQK